MSLLSWAREKLGWGLRVVYSASPYYGGSTWAKKAVTPDGAMNLSAWWRGIKLYAEVTGTTPIKFYERLDGGGRKQRNDHPLADIIGANPNEDQTPQEFWGAQAAGLCIFGNSYAEKLFVGTKLVGLQPLPGDTTPYRDQNDELYYRFTIGGKQQKLPRDKVFHTRGFSLGGDLGISPLEAARQTLAISLATEEATGKTFAFGMRHSGFFTTPTGVKITKEQRDQFKANFIAPLTGANADAHYGILEQGFDFKTINIPPKDAEMLLTRRFNVEEIARFLGMPPILLGHSADGQTMWGTGIGAIITMWRTLGLDAFFTTIEQSINKRLLTAAERSRFYAEFDRNAILQADPAARSEMYWKMVQIAAMTPNQICDKENMPRFDGGDARLINSTLIPLEDAGKKFDAAGPDASAPDAIALPPAANDA